MSTYTANNIETAMCLWEAVLEKDGLDAEVIEWLQKKRNQDGSADLRSWILTLAPACDKAWESNFDDTQVFDWEFCPAWLNDHIRREHLISPSAA